VVVGGGAVGTRRARALAEAGAAVTVVAPDACDELLSLAEAGEVTHCRALFSPDVLEPETFLVVAATDNAEVNALVARIAHEKRVLVNLAAGGDEGDEGDFATMAAVRRGDLLLAVTTGGAGPALTARLRRELEAEFGPEWAGYVALLAEARREAKSRNPDDPMRRAAALRRLAACDAVRERLAAGDEAGAWEEARACLSA
jgi:siroheme synthase, N-terminal domain